MDEEEKYAVPKSVLTAIADRTRAMAGVTESLSLDEIVYWLGRVTYIPQARGMTEYVPVPETTGDAILPTVQRCSGQTEYIYNPTTSITGELVPSAQKGGIKHVYEKCE